jgi:5-methylthioadenosine/S-adenosylhomocysteine deaminase
MLVESTEEADVDTVVVDGRILKRAGKLTALVPEQIIAGASASLDGVRKRITAA